MPCTQRRISVTVTGSVSWPPPRRWPRWRSTSVVSNPTTSSLAMAPPSRGAGSPAPAHSMGDGRSGRVAQRLAAVGAAVSPGLYGASHFHGPTAYDLVAWAALSLVVVRLLRTTDDRLWLAAGAVAGLGFANKHSIAFLGLGLVAGVVLSGHGRRLRSRWFLAGIAVALVVALPELVWQAQHGWPTIGMTRRLNEKNGGLGRAVLFPLGQLAMVAP